MTRRITAILMAMAVLTIAVAQSVEQNANLSASQLMEFILGGFNGLQPRYEEAKIECDGLLLRADALPRIADMDSRIIEMQKLIDDIRNALVRIQNLEDVKNTAMGNIALLRRSSSASANDLTMASGFEQNMKEWSHNLDVQVVAVKHRLNVIIQALASLPPPKFFINRYGMRFVLVKVKNGKSFYVSEEPVRMDQLRAVAQARGRAVGDAAGTGYWTDIRISDAMALAKDLSTLDRAEYGLLSAVQAKYLKEGSGYVIPKIAVWLDNKLSTDLNEQRQAKLFGIDMVEVWDPSGALRNGGSSAIYGELSNAHYDDLGCIIVAGVATGKRIYFEQLNRQAESMK